MNHRMDTSRPVLLIDGASRTDVGVTRSLGQYGVPVHLLVHRRRSVTTASRFVTATHSFPGNEAPDAARVERIREVARRLPERPVILATGDTAVRFLSRVRAAIEEVVDHDLPPAELIEVCQDKDRFAELAARLELPVPDTLVPASVEEVENRAADLSYPVFVKPGDRSDWGRLPPGTVQQTKGQRVDSAAELVRFFQTLARHNAHRVVIQSFVRGGDEEHVDVHAYADPEGRVVAAFSGRKLRVYPAHAGMGAYVRSERMPELIELAEQILTRLSYTGMANMNFKQDAVDKSYRLLEINCRFSVWTELPMRAGCNLPLTAYASITGQPLPPVHQREGVSWVDLRRDRQSFRTYRRDGEWGWPGYLRSLTRARWGAFFAWDDPKPFLHQLVFRNAG